MKAWGVAWVMLALPLAAAEWQWSVPVPSVTSPETQEPPRAFLWIPPACVRVRAVVVGQHNMLEEPLLESPVFRQALAEKGVAEAWFHLGILAEDGLGEPRDPGAALARYRRAAEAGSAKAQYRLGLLHLEGRLVAQDRAQARYWLAVAAASGDDEAARRLDALRREEAPEGRVAAQ